MFIHRIQEYKEWVKGYENIGKASCENFQEMLIWENNTINEENIECIPRMVN